MPGQFASAVVIRATISSLDIGWRRIPRFAAAVSTVRDRGAGVLLVDHNVALVLEVCERVHVLDQGTTLAEGTPTEIRADLGVAAAYLGESAAAEESE